MTGCVEKERGQGSGKGENPNNTPSGSQTQLLPSHEKAGSRLPHSGYESGLSNKRNFEKTHPETGPDHSSYIYKQIHIFKILV